MGRLIDADALKETLSGNDIVFDILSRIIDVVPTVEERKKGKWEKKYYGLPDIVCSECGNDGNKKMRFCPNCGADMRGAKG